MEILENLLEALKSVEDKLAFLQREPSVQSFLESAPEWYRDLDRGDQFLIVSTVAAGQGHLLEGEPKGLRSFLHMLAEMERFYEGGILGYQLQVLRLLEGGAFVEEGVLHQPSGVDLEKETPAVRRKIRIGLEHLPELGEVWAVGGAGDRLALMSEEQEPLPAAQLLLGGRTLLEGLVRDVEARESLYEKIYGKKITVPIALMTSHEKQNHKRIVKLLERHDWFGRGRESFRLFTQGLVPMVTDRGEWVASVPFHPLVKPGGHGVIWKLAIDEGVFDWFEGLGKKKGLVRQINNPAAGVDYGLLAFTGVGFEGDKAFGFASCPRLAKMAEGMDVLLERQGGYTLSNIEYTEFARRGLEEATFPANTNILFFDFQAIRKAVKKLPIPGLLLNMKAKVRLHGEEHSAGRLESTMQNISDVISGEDPAKLPSYITFNKRRKTLSVAKNAYSADKPIDGTPEGCFYEMMQNREELFGGRCGMKLPRMPTRDEYIKRGPSFFILYSPSLGPLYSIIEQKIKGGALADHSDMVLEIDALHMEDVHVKGSLLIDADEGRCLLRNVRVVNEGVDYTAPENSFWSHQLERREALKITLQGDAEFIAEGVAFKGNFDLIVPDGQRMRAYQEGGELRFRLEPLKEPLKFSYEYDSEDHIKVNFR